MIVLAPRLVPRSTTALVALATCALGAGCVGQVDPSAPSLTDAVETDGHPAVVAIVHVSTPEEVLCTGTLIAPGVVLTAAHCGVSLAPDEFAIRTDTPLVGAGAPIAIREARAHPAFVIERPDADLALLRLASSPSISPIRVLASPTLDDAVELVGYGRTSGAASDADRRRVGTARIDAIADEHVVLAGEPSLPCGGDSGGPVLAARGVIVAVVSRGDPACDTAARAARVDVHLASFVDPLVARWSTGAALGAACTDDTDCSEGECVAIEGASPVCTMRCAARACPDGFACTHAGGIDLFCTRVPPPSSGGCVVVRGARAQVVWAAAFALVALGRRRRRLARQGTQSASAIVPSGKRQPQSQPSPVP